jgi:hypothetical protein
MNKGLLFWLCLLVLSSSLTSAALPAARVALVIGNANYPDARTPLSNTIKDADQGAPFSGLDRRGYFQARPHWRISRLQ